MRSRAQDCIRAVMAALSLGAAACTGVRQLPPRHPPAHTMPAVELPDTELKPGYGRVVLDSVDEPAEVHAVWAGPLSEAGHHVLPERQQQFSGRVCTTVCTADLPLGRYDIYFTVRSAEVVKGDHDVLSVQPGLTVHRRALGATKPESEGGRGAGWALTILGVSAMGGGATLLLGGALTDFDSIGAAPGVVTLLLGGLTTVIGAVVLDGARGEQIDGATTEWVEPLSAPVAAPEPAPAAADTAQPGADQLVPGQVKAPVPSEDSAGAEESERP